MSPVPSYDMIDEALLRPGRLEVQMEIGLCVGVGVGVGVGGVCPLQYLYTQSVTYSHVATAFP